MRIRTCWPSKMIYSSLIMSRDHEQAFSFLMGLSVSAEPWTLDDQQYLNGHVFYRRLKSKEVDLASSTASLRGLSAALIARFVADVPEEWQMFPRNGRMIM